MLVFAALVVTGPFVVSGAAALVAGEAVFGDIPADVVDACRRHDLVLVAVPVDVSAYKTAPRG